MAIDLGTLRETARGHQKDLLVKKTKTPPTDEEILKLMVNHQFENQLENKSQKKGRPHKQENQFLNKRLTLILTEEQKTILNKRRGANTLGEIDASSFVREWLLRTNCFDTVNNPIEEIPTSNLPK